MSTPYSVYKPDGATGTNPILVPEGSIDNSTLYNVSSSIGIQLIGRNALNYGEATAQNFVQLASNFAGGVMPPDQIALQGQLWFEVSSATSGSLYVRTTSNTSGGLANWKQLFIDNAGTGILPTSSGGTGFSSFTDGDLLVGNSSGTLSKLGVGTNSYVLTMVGGLPAWAPVTGGSGGTVTSVDVVGGTTGLTTSGGPIIGAGTITLGGTLGIANGGTGQTTATAAANALLPTQTGNANKVLTTDGSGTLSWQSPATVNSFETTQPIPVSPNFSVSVAHGLGGMPSRYSISFRCVISEFGWFPGDEIPIAIVDAPGISSYTAWASPTTLGIAFWASSAAIRIARRDVAGGFTMTLSNWELIFRAQR